MAIRVRPLSTLERAEGSRWTLKDQSIQLREHGGLQHPEFVFGNEAVNSHGVPINVIAYRYESPSIFLS